MDLPKILLHWNAGGHSVVATFPNSPFPWYARTFWKVMFSPLQTVADIEASIRRLCLEDYDKLRHQREWIRRALQTEFDVTVAVDEEEVVVWVKPLFLGPD